MSESFTRINEKEYEIKIGGKHEIISCPFGKTELLFKAFISNGGIINPSTGQVQNDLLSLIASFKDVGNILLSEYSKDGELITFRSCADLTSIEVINLFQMATEIIQSFTQELLTLQTKQTAEVPDQTA